MISDFLTLWVNRERPTSIKRFIVVLAKRLINSFALINLLIKPVLLRFRGAKVGRLVVIGKSRIEGQFSNLSIGNESSLGRCEISLHDSVSIGNKVVINDGVILLTGSHSLTDPTWQHKTKPITINDYAWVCTNAIILPGVSIGVGAVIGAGAVVRSDVSAYSVVVGNPAKHTDIKRVTKMSYSPVLMNAPFEAWIGRNVNNYQSPQ